MKGIAEWLWFFYTPLYEVVVSLIQQIVKYGSSWYLTYGIQVQSWANLGSRDLAGLLHSMPGPRIPGKWNPRGCLQCSDPQSFLDWIAFIIPVFVRTFSSSWGADQRRWRRAWPRPPNFQKLLPRMGAPGSLNPSKWLLGFDLFILTQKEFLAICRSDRLPCWWAPRYWWTM